MTDREFKMIKHELRDTLGNFTNPNFPKHNYSKKHQ